MKFILNTIYCDKGGLPYNLELIMANKNQHVVTHNGAWAVRGENNLKVTSIHNTQAEAEKRARSIAMNQKSEVLIHGTNGEIRARNSYGNDPYPPKG